jgi:ABC-2 type transport system ATP-binding protein
MLRVTELTKQYGQTLALDNLTLEVPAGAVYGLLGPTGAGKTTFLRLVMGFIFPDDGKIDRGEMAPDRIGYLPERAFYPPRFAIRDYLTTMGRLAGLGEYALRRAVDRLLGQLGLETVANQRLSTCSRGMLQRVGLAQALMGDPPLLMLDEPVLGLDPAGQKFMRDQIATLHQAGKTVLLSSHNLGEVTRVCTHVAVLDNGRLVRSGPMETILTPRAQVTITTGPMPSGLPEKLEALASDIVVEEGGLTLAGDAVSQKVTVLRLLLDAGVDIRELSTRHATLEEVYLEVTARPGENG